MRQKEVPKTLKVGPDRPDVSIEEAVPVRVVHRRRDKWEMFLVAIAAGIVAGILSGVALAYII